MTWVSSEDISLSNNGFNIQKYFFWVKYTTLAKKEIIYPENVGAKVAMDFTQDKCSATMAIKRIKNLGALLELPAK